MLFYGFSVQGKSHIERGTVCQDYNKVNKLNNEWYLGIVADGVGSALHSDIGSRVAAESLSLFLQKNIKSKNSNEQLEELLRQGYEYAMEQVGQYAAKQNGALPDYDTTMSAVLYNGASVIYGHAGDGGILVRFNDGSTKPITKRQKGADGTSVRPLRAGNQSWEFGIYDTGAAGVLLVTDGMLDGGFQPVLINLPSDMMAFARGNYEKNNAYITATEFFMNPNTVFFNRKVANASQFLKKYMEGNLGEKDAEDFLCCMRGGYRKMFDRSRTEELCQRISKYHYTLAALKKVTDDKSIVCLINEKARITPQDVTYYYEPDWEQQRNDYERILYGKTMSRPTKDKTTMSLKDSWQGSKDKEAAIFEDTSEEIEVEYEAKKRFRPYSFKIITLASFLAFAIIAGIVMGITIKNKRMGSDTEQREKRVYSSTVPAVTSAPYENNTDEPEDFGKDDEQKEDNNFYLNYNKCYKDGAEEFVDMLTKEMPDEVPDRIKNVMTDLNKILEKNKLKEKLREFLSGRESKEENKRGHTTKSEETDSPEPFSHGTSASALPEDNFGEHGTSNSAERIREKDMKRLLNYIIVVNTPEEKKQFMDEFEKKYKKLDTKEQKTLCDNLQDILDEGEA